MLSFSASMTDSACGAHRVAVARTRDCWKPHAAASSEIEAGDRNADGLRCGTTFELSGAHADRGRRANAEGRPRLSEGLGPMPDFERLTDDLGVWAAAGPLEREYRRGYVAGKSRARWEVLAVVAAVLVLWMGGAGLHGMWR